MSKKANGEGGFIPVSLLPSTDAFPEILVEFMSYAGLSNPAFSKLTCSEGAGIYPISESVLKSWRNKGIKPHSATRQSIVYVFEKVCIQESIARVWVDSLNSALINIKTDENIEEQREESLGDLSELDSNFEKVKGFTSTSILKKDVDVARLTGKLNRKVLAFIFLCFILISFLFIFAFKENKVIVVNDIKVANDQKTLIAPALNDVDSFDSEDKVEAQSIGFQLLKDEHSELKNRASVNTKIEGVTDITETASLVEYSSGLTKEVYVFQNPQKHLPSYPSGLSIAKLEHIAGGKFGFAEHITDKAMAAATADKDFGLHYEGYLELDEAGEHFIHLEYLSGQHSLNQLFKKCKIVLSINDDIMAELVVPIGLKQRKSHQLTRQLNQGFNKFNMWVACNNLRSFNPKQDYDAYKGTKVTLYLRQPNEAKLELVSADRLFH